MKKTIKAWALIREEGFVPIVLSTLGHSHYELFPSKKDALYFAEGVIGKPKILPATVTYEVPTKR